MQRSKQKLHLKRLKMKKIFQLSCEYGAHPNQINQWQGLIISSATLSRTPSRPFPAYDIARSGGCRERAGRSRYMYGDMADVMSKPQWRKRL